MKIKVRKHKLNIHCRGSPRRGRTQQHPYCLRYAHSQHIESHLGKKQQQAKIPIAFLFSQLHFNNITSHALFYGDHLVMRNKRCAVQNQGITLIVLYSFTVLFVCCLFVCFFTYFLKPGTSVIGLLLLWYSCLIKQLFFFVFSACILILLSFIFFSLSLFFLSHYGQS